EGLAGCRLRRISRRAGRGRHRVARNGRRHAARTRPPAADPLRSGGRRRRAPGRGARARPEGARMPERDSRRRLLRAGARAGAGAALSRAVAGALAALGAPAAQAATIVAVRVWPARDYTRVALELDEPLRSTQMRLSDPPRIVVDLEGLE